MRISRLLLATGGLAAPAAALLLAPQAAASVPDAALNGAPDATVDTAGLDALPAVPAPPALPTLPAPVIPVGDILPANLLRKQAVDDTPQVIATAPAPAAGPDPDAVNTTVTAAQLQQGFAGAGHVVDNVVSGRALADLQQTYEETVSSPEYAAWVGTTANPFAPRDGQGADRAAAGIGAFVDAVSVHPVETVQQVIAEAGGPVRILTDPAGAAAEVLTKVVGADMVAEVAGWFSAEIVPAVVDLAVAVLPIAAVPVAGLLVGGLAAALSGTAGSVGVTGVAGIAGIAGVAGLLGVLGAPGAGALGVLGAAGLAGGLQLLVSVLAAGALNLVPALPVVGLGLSVFGPVLALLPVLAGLLTAGAAVLPPLAGGLAGLLGVVPLLFGGIGMTGVAGIAGIAAALAGIGGVVGVSGVSGIAGVLTVLALAVIPVLLYVAALAAGGALERLSAAWSSMADRLGAVLRAGWEHSALSDVVDTALAAWNRTDTGSTLADLAMLWDALVAGLPRIDIAVPDLGGFGAVGLALAVGLAVALGAGLLAGLAGGLAAVGLAVALCPVLSVVVAAVGIGALPAEIATAVIAVALVVGVIGVIGAAGAAGAAGVVVAVGAVSTVAAVAAVAALGVTGVAALLPVVAGLLTALLAVLPPLAGGLTGLGALVPLVGLLGLLGAGVPVAGGLQLLVSVLAAGILNIGPMVALVPAAAVAAGAAVSTRSTKRVAVPAAFRSDFATGTLDNRDRSLVDVTSLVAA
ncbi:hypothetical protein OZD69_07000 [Wolbachia endosymbiont of Drosophila chauvacae]|nr:hypothetical protein [Wolbachia endosymbiont of Drosophila chauvacae]